MDEKKEVAELYFDSARITITLFGVNLSLGLRAPHPTSQEELKSDEKQLLIARTGIYHAKVLTMLLKKQLKQFEEKTGSEIILPSEAYEALGLDPTDW